MLHLDYVSCLLTVLSTVMVGRRKWQGWVVAGANSAIISVIGVSTGQWGFVPANAFCIAIYLYNIRKWRTPEEDSVSQTAALSGTLNGRVEAGAEVGRHHRPRRAACRTIGKSAADERFPANPIRPRPVPNQRESCTPF